MRSQAWAWLIALIALVLAVTPLATMSGIFGVDCTVHDGIHLSDEGHEAVAEVLGELLSPT